MIADWRACHLEAHDLTLMRGDSLLFANLSLNVNSGEALALRGPNGSGKTSLLRVLAGLTRPDSGRIRWCGYDAIALAPARRSATFYAGHAQALKDDLNVAENLDFQLQLDGVDIAAKTRDHALECAGLWTRRHLSIKKLSQGQKRRVGLARMMLAQRPLWLLDEPTNALDAEGAAWFGELVRAHLAAGGMAIIASHLPLDGASTLRELRLTEQ